MNDALRAMLSFVEWDRSPFSLNTNPPALPDDCKSLDLDAFWLKDRVSWEKMVGERLISITTTTHCLKAGFVINFEFIIC
jgi:hypothetical protein